MRWNCFWNSKKLPFLLLATLSVFALQSVALANAAPDRLKKAVAVLPVAVADGAGTLPDDYSAQFAQALEAALKNAGFTTRQAAKGETDAAKPEAEPEAKPADDDPFAAIEAEATTNTDAEAGAASVKVPPGAQFGVLTEMRGYETDGGQSTLALNVRLVQASGGGVLGEREISAKAADSEKLSEQAAASVAEFVAAQSREVPWQAQVAQVEENDAGIVLRVYLRAGTIDGLQVGDRFNVYRPGKPVTDPETGEVLSPAKDRRVGVIRVQKLTASMATAEPTLGDGFKAGDVARYFLTR